MTAEIPLPCRSDVVARGAEGVIGTNGSKDGSRGLVLFLVNTAEYFFSHRLPVALEAHSRGYSIAVVAGDAERWKESFAAYNFASYRFPYTRGRGSLTRELTSVISLARLVRGLRPSIIHAVTLKPIIHAIAASWTSRDARLVFAVTGLGYLFIDESRSSRLLRRAVCMILRLGLQRRRTRTIFQNPDDQALFVDLGIVPKKQTALIRGSGVDVRLFPFEPECEGASLIVFPSRLVSHKGVREFINAARLLKEWGVNARCALVGELDPDNPTSLSRDELDDAVNSGIVEAWGYRKDMPAVFAQAHVVCLPSYREGLPKALIEAACAGRAIVTTDAPGCREIVRDGENGLLVRVGDHVALAAALQRLVRDPGLRKTLGAAGRAYVLQDFAADRIARQTVDLYDELMSSVCDLPHRG